MNAWPLIQKGILLVPLSALRFMGACIGMVLFVVLHSRRRVVQTNLRLCFPEWSQRRRLGVTLGVFQTFAQAWLDRVWLWGASEARIRQRIRWVGDVQRLNAAGPVVVFAPHFMGLDAAWTGLTLDTQRPWVTVYSPQSDLRLDQWVRQGRSRFGGAKLVARLDGVRPVVQALKEGAGLYLLPDLNFDPSESVFVPFFGVMACTVPSLSRLARLSKADVVPVLARIVSGGYEIHVLPAWQAYPSGDAVADTERMNRELEAYIRTMPDQYYWVHKRFKDQPKGGPSPYT